MFSTIDDHLRALSELAADQVGPPGPADWDGKRPSQAIDADALLTSYGSWPLVLLAAGVEPGEPVVPRRYRRPGRRATAADVERRRRRVAKLRGQGFTYAAIAGRLGVARSTVHRDLAAHHRDGARPPHTRRPATCPGCAGPMTPPESDGVGPSACWDCALELRRGAARLRVVVSMRRWAHERGRPPTVGEWRAPGQPWPAPSAVQRLFGSWSAGLVAAGYAPRSRGRPRLPR